MDSASSVRPHMDLPIPQPPKPISETEMPVRPSLRWGILTAASPVLMRGL